MSTWRDDKGVQRAATAGWARAFSRLFSARSCVSILNSACGCGTRWQWMQRKRQRRTASSVPRQARGARSAASAQAASCCTARRNARRRQRAREDAGARASAFICGPSASSSAVRRSVSISARTAATSLALQVWRSARRARERGASAGGCESQRAFRSVRGTMGAPGRRGAGAEHGDEARLSLAQLRQRGGLRRGVRAASSGGAAACGR